jgi:hypothetical protein
LRGYGLQSRFQSSLGCLSEQYKEMWLDEILGLGIGIWCFPKDSAGRHSGNALDKIIPLWTGSIDELARDIWAGVGWQTLKPFRIDIFPVRVAWEVSSPSKASYILPLHFDYWNCQRWWFISGTPRVVGLLSLSLNRAPWFSCCTRY